MLFPTIFNQSIKYLLLRGLGLAFSLLIGVFQPAISKASEAGGAPVLAIDWQAELDDESVSIAILLDQAVSFEVLYLTNPNRMIIELPVTSFGFDPAQVQPIGPIDNIRYGAFDEETARIVFSLAGPAMLAALPEETKSVFQNTDKGAILSLTLAPVSQAIFSQEAQRQLAQRAEPIFAPKTDRIGEAEAKSNTVFSVVIDPGHGGVDGGAEGLGGTKEKNVTLAFALALQEALKDQPNFRVTLTRNADQFVRLKERVRIARQSNADLFLSLHADSIQYRSIFGATVYTLSQKASDRISANIAQQANNADLFAGVVIEEADEDVTDILMDLLREETDVFSERFANSLVAQLQGQKIRMIKNPHRRAGFQVLSAPDVPSILLELGYLSNKDDESRLKDPKWRARVATIIAEAVSQFGAQVLASRL